MIMAALEFCGDHMVFFKGVEGGRYLQSLWHPAHSSPSEPRTATGIKKGLPCRTATTMRLALLLLVAALFQLALCQRQDPFFWLSALRSRGYTYGSLQADTTGGDCPIECDCPPSFPIAMYCDSRNMQQVPYVPSRMKYLYLQHNEITGIPDGAFDNATGLVWVMMHQNKLSSDKIGKKVFAKLKSLDRLYLHHNELTRVPPICQSPSGICA
ncbi:hypothetical protein AGOR_G00154750 [Albula goreensis]|uniref:Fibromodulin n=1 Tax=Albula goreensis TaxID=1534307 RepID=A0A8T3D202_9TELE|nr:hypothetical protein AGOR_G00154750 [Albula goreensis]